MSVDIVKVRRGNVFLKVSADDVQRYLAKGYDVVDANGNVIKASVPKDLGTLQKAFTDKSNEIQKLKDEIAQLKAQLEEAKKQPVAQAQPQTTKRKKSE